MKDYREEEKLYPVYYNGKKYTEETCDDVFRAFYHSRFSLNSENGVYVGDQVWVYPDGNMGEY